MFNRLCVWPPSTPVMMLTSTTTNRSQWLIGVFTFFSSNDSSLHHHQQVPTTHWHVSFWAWLDQTTMTTINGHFNMSMDHQVTTPPWHAKPPQHPTAPDRFVITSTEMAVVAAAAAVGSRNYYLLDPSLKLLMWFFSYFFLDYSEVYLHASRLLSTIIVLLVCIL